MPISRRRRRAYFVVALLALLAGGIAAIAAAASDRERVASLWVGTVLLEEGLLVTEVIDYDFGPASRRGIYRDIPDAIPESIAVGSISAPSDALVTVGFSDVNVRIGDPDITVRGRHRYRIEYLLPRDAVIQDGVFSFNAVGTGWNVALHDVIVVGAFTQTLDNTLCFQGNPWSERRCNVDQPDSNRIALRVDKLEPGEGITISATLGETVQTAAPVPPTGPAQDPGAGVLVTTYTAIVGFVAAAFAAAAAVRRAGRERIWQGGAADAAWGEIGDGLQSTLVDEKELGEMATIEFEPPRDLSAVEAGLLIDETTKDRHLSAWLLESAIRDEIRIDGADEPVIRWGDAPAHPAVHPILTQMFDGRSEVELGSYDADFKTGWDMLRKELIEWRHGSAHWDEAGLRRQVRVRAMSSLALLGGGAALAVGAGFANTRGANWLALVLLGAAVFGAACGALALSYELLVRTESGSALWLRVESFRRFLENSEAHHVDEAADKGVLRQYTAWAVALGESKAWADAAVAAAKNNPELRNAHGNDFAFIAAGHSVSSAARAAATAPSSSGSGGSFGGSVGGGGGGGGGGSW